MASPPTLSSHPGMHRTSGPAAAAGRWRIRHVGDGGLFRGLPCKIIAVTGSDGKTTTTTLIAEILKHAGRRVWLGGNIGTPLLPVAEKMEPDDIAVVELSSFQLMGMTRSADVAVADEPRAEPPRCPQGYGRVHRRQAERLPPPEQNRQTSSSTWTTPSPTASRRALLVQSRSSPPWPPGTRRVAERRHHLPQRYPHYEG